MFNASTDAKYWSWWQVTEVIETAQILAKSALRRT